MSVESVTTLPGTPHEQQTAWLAQARADQHGAFAYFLAKAFSQADDVNKKKLAKGFPELFDTLVAAD